MFLANRSSGGRSQSAVERGGNEVNIDRAAGRLKAAFGDGSKRRYAGDLKHRRGVCG